MKKLLIAILVAIVAIIVWQMAPQNTSGEIIRVGVILPLSGQYASIGEADRNGILMAKEDLKADNIELYFEDDKYDAKTAVTAYKKLRDLNKIDAVIVLSAPSIQSIAPLTDADNIPLLGLGATLVYEEDSVFQLMPSSNSLFPTLGKEAGKLYKKIAVAHSNADLFATNTAAFISGLPSDVIYTDITIPPATDYRTEVQKIIQDKPDAVTTFFPKDDAIKFLKALSVQDAKGEIKIICDFGTELAVQDYINAIGADRLEGCVSTNLGDTTLAAFKEQYIKTYGIDPQITADFAYDALGIIEYLANKGSKSKWIDILSDKDFAYTGKASGEIRFNNDGTRLDMPPKVNVFRNGTFVPMN